MTSRKPLLITATILALTLAASMVTVPAMAQIDPHFIGTPTITKNPNFSLTASFEAGGLPAINQAGGAFLTSSGGTAGLVCVGPTGNAHKVKEVNFGSLTGTNMLALIRNGHTIGTAPLGPPPLPAASEICPNAKWHVNLVSITYENVVLHLQAQEQSDILTFNFGNVDP